MLGGVRPSLAPMSPSLHRVDFQVHLVMSCPPSKWDALTWLGLMSSLFGTPHLMWAIFHALGYLDIVIPTL